MSNSADNEKQQLEQRRQRERRRQHLLDMETTEIAEAPSVGERLLPLLYAALETCWVDAIFLGLAALGLFSTHNPLMPLWVPFVFIASSQWLYGVLERREGRKAQSAAEESEGDAARAMLPEAPLFITLIALVTLVVIWASVYAQRWLLFDPRWLLALLNDILLLNVQAYHTIIVLALALYFCWRGIRLAQRDIQPATVFNILRVGMIIIIAVVLLRAAVASANPAIGGDGNNELMLLLLVPLFLFFALAAHALAQITFVRHTHPTGLEGSTAAQEQSILSITAIIGAVLLVIAFWVNSFASPAFLAQTQQTFAWVGAVYDFLVRVVSQALVFLLTPVFWLLSLWFQQHAPQLPHITRPGDAIKNKIHAPPPQTYPGVILFAKILVPILVIVLLLLLLRFALRRRRVRLVRRGRPNEVRESLWSWSLFWTQVRALLLGLFRRLFPHKQKQEEQQGEAFAELQGEPGARSIREVYRLLLRRAAGRGYPRHRDETPYEFRQRLDERLPQTEPQLATITEAYAATRYGGLVPDEATVAHIRQQWAELEQNTRVSS